MGRGYLKKWDLALHRISLKSRLVSKGLSRERSRFLNRSLTKSWKIAVGGIQRGMEKGRLHRREGAVEWKVREMG